MDRSTTRDEETFLIKEVHFGLFSPEEIKRNSVAEITQPRGLENGNPIENGLSDPNLGTVRLEMKCPKCGNSKDLCIGHFGHITLAQPFYHYGYLDYVRKVLECICHSCGRLLVDYSDPEVRRIVKRYRGKDRLKRIHVLCSNRSECTYQRKKDAPKEGDNLDIVNDDEFWKALDMQPPEPDVDARNQKPCGNSVPEVQPDSGPDQVGMLIKKSSGEPIWAQQVLEIFRKMSESDIRILGFDGKNTRPEWMILTVLPVPPPHVRPEVYSDQGVSHDDITHHLSTIISKNEDLKRKLREEGLTQTLKEEQVKELQLHLTTYMNNEKPSIKRATTKKGRPLKVISARLGGKQGHIRGHLSGKRVNFSARSVISPDPSIAIDEVGVPEEIAKTLTFPEIVTDKNKDELDRLVQAGPDELEGANYIICKGSRTDLRYGEDKARAKIQPGDIVERHLRNGDIVVFNRQPSLHRMSMMGHSARIMKGSTFRLNLSVTTPYNADFDGDEMNLHVPQSQTARAEVKHIMFVPNQIVSPKANRPVIGLVQDSLLAARLMTLRSTFLNRNEVMNLMMWISHGQTSSTEHVMLPPPCVMRPKENIYLWSGKQIFSLFLPPINLDAKSWVDKSVEPDKGWMPNDDRKVIIRKGKLLAGILDQQTLATSEQSLVHVVLNSVDKAVARNFLGQTQVVVNAWLESRGFSVGITDTFTSGKAWATVKEKLGAVRDKTRKAVQDVLGHKMERAPGMTLHETFEANVNKELNSAVDESGKAVLTGTRFWNSLLQMCQAGSKGKLVNLSEIMAAVGQQNIEGKRIRFGFRKRTLPHYVKDDLDDLEARGFCKHSYLRGLQPAEFFFHSMGGRVGIIDTACKTSDTGYIQRRLIKAMESHCVAYDGTVRNSLNDIVQFIYGGDGLDSIAIEGMSMKLFTMGNEEFDETYRFDITQANFGEGYMDREVIDDVLQQREREDSLLREELDRLSKFRELMRGELLPNFLNGEDLSTRVYLPVNVERLIETAKQECKINQYADKSNLHPSYVIERVKGLIQKLVVVKGDDAIAKEAQANATLFLRIKLYSALASKPLIFMHRMTVIAFHWVLEEIERRFAQAIVAPGEMVGTIAGQSIGEPATQMTLNTFHFAGISAKDVTLGIPRLQEIMNVTESMRTPRVVVYADDESCENLEMVKDIRSQIESAPLWKLVRMSEIYYDPCEDKGSVVEEDADWVRHIYEFKDIFVKYEPTALSPWVLRLVFDQRRLQEHGLTAKNVADALKEDWKDTIAVLFTEPTYQGDQVVRIRFVTKSTDKTLDFTDLREMESALLSRSGGGFNVKGIGKISHTNHGQSKRYRVDETTGEVNMKSKEYVIYTEGTALLDILAKEHVDTRRTWTNNIKEVLDVLGIEAAWRTVFNELLAVNEKVGYLNHRHLHLLADSMTHYGEIRAISRHGVFKAPTGPLMKAAYEKTGDVLFEAAAFAQVDRMVDISSNVLVGRPGRVGTGMIDVLLDPCDESLPAGKGSSEDVIVGPYASPSPYISPRRGQIHAQVPGVYPSPDQDSGYEHVSPDPYGGDDASPFMASPADMSPASPMGNASPVRYVAIASPVYSPASPGSPSYSPASPASPSYSPMSPSYSPASPSYSPTSPSYSPTSPSYSPTSPAYSPTSPAYSPMSAEEDKRK